MQRIRISQIQPGQTFEQSLYLSSGQKLLGPGVPLTARHIQAMQRSGEVEVLAADSLHELEESGLVRRLEKKRLAVGQTLQEGLMTRTGSVLLEPGQSIEQHHLDALAISGEAYQATQPSSGHDRRDRILMADVLVEELEQQLPAIPMRVTAHEQADWIQPARGAAWPGPEELSQRRNAAVERLRVLLAQIEAGIATPLRAFESLVDELMADLSRHPSRFTQLALLCPRRRDYLPDHAYTVSVLAMAVAATLRWPRQDVRQMGLAGLLFDLGMLLVPERIRVGSSQLSDIDRSRVQRHPIYTLSMMQSIDDVPLIVQLAALQHHERENGSGYPQGKRKNAICDYARVLAVADTFAAGTAPRHYRRQKLPYLVMEETLRSAAAITLWAPAVRGLVQVAGLFPVGSYVKLSNGVNAHVIASNEKEVDRPVVQPLDREGQPSGQPIDLSTLSKQALAVIRAIPTATA
ncbi:MAG TPA: HD domain-containing phosphohydrolase [Phycisphaeraceae bacterium]